MLTNRYTSYAMLDSRGKLMVSDSQTLVLETAHSATGKSSILRTAGSTPGVSFIVDTTFSNTARSMLQVDGALKSGRRVEIRLVHRAFRAFRDSVPGMVERALDPNSGRIVPIDDMARTHFGAQRSILEARERFQSEKPLAIGDCENSPKRHSTASCTVQLTPSNLIGRGVQD